MKRDLSLAEDDGPLDAKQFVAWRKRLGWTQREAAEWLAVTLKAYQKWEQAKREAQNQGPIKFRMREASNRHWRRMKNDRSVP